MDKIARGVAAAFLASVCLTVPTSAHDFRAGRILIDHPWSRETAPRQSVGAGFMTIKNEGATGDRLLSATADIATRVEIHTVGMEGGVMRMRKLPEGLPIPPKRTVTLKPGGYHIMLIGLKRPLVEGQLVAARLRFQKAGVVRIAFKVEDVGTTGGDHDQH